MDELEQDFHDMRADDRLEELLEERDEEWRESLAWRPIETAPTDGTWILLTVSGKHPETGEPYVPLVAHWSLGERWWADEDEDKDLGRYHPTHWMRLPDPPDA